jgi:hypothetical protein
MDFKTGDRVKVRHEQCKMGFSRFSNLEPEITYHEGTVNEQRGGEVRITLDKEFCGWKTLVASKEIVIWS